MNYLIIGDPDSSTACRLIDSGIPPQNITVWENTRKGKYMVSLRGCRVTDDLEELKGMRFDIVIGNPPYSNRSGVSCADTGGSGKSLDDVFTLECMKLSDRVRLVIRAKEFSKQNSSFKRKLFSGQHLRSITWLPASTFPMVQNTVTCVIDWDATYVGETRISYEDGTVLNRLLDEDSVVKLNNPDYVPSVDNNMRHRYLRGKMPRRSIDNAPDGVRIVEIMGKGESPVVRTASNVPDGSGCNSHGVVMNYASSWDGFDRLHIKPFDAAISGSVIMLHTDSDEESQRLIDHLKSPDIVELLKGLKSGFNNSGRIFEMIPDMT